MKVMIMSVTKRMELVCVIRVVMTLGAIKPVVLVVIKKLVIKLLLTVKMVVNKLYMVTNVNKIAV